MRELRVTIDGKQHTYRVPENYREMDEKQFFVAVLHVMRMIGREAFWERFVGMRQALSSKLPEWVWMQMDGMVEYIPRLSEGIDKFLIPSLPCRGKLFLEKLHAPKPMLDGMSFQQFMAADNFFSYYCVTQREEFIDRLVASLYLREHETFVLEGKKDVLVPMEKREAYIHHHLSAAVRFAVFVNWILIKNWLSTIFKHLFPKGTSNGKPQASDWLQIFDSFVGDNIPFIQEYQKMPCMDALRIIDGKIKQQQTKT